MVLALLLSMVIIIGFCACSSPEYRSEAIVSPSATPNRVNSEKMNDDAAKSLEEAYAKEDFEALRQAIITEMENMLEADPISQLDQILLNYSEDKIVISAELSYDYTHSYRESVYKATGKDPFADTEDMRYILANELRLVDGKLVDKGVALTPVFIAHEKRDNTISEVLLPEMYDESSRKDDLNEIFGDNAKYLDIEVLPEEYQYALSQIRSVVCSVMLNGGFDSFPNEITNIFTSLVRKHNLLTDEPTLSSNVFMSIVKQNTSYSFITVPMWYELGKSEEDNGDIAIYTAMYFATIDKLSDGTVTASASIIPNLVYVTQNDNGFNITEYSSYINDGELFQDSVQRFMGDYAQSYYDFIKSDEFADFTDFCENVSDSILAGSFDYENDQLIFAPQGR